MNLVGLIIQLISGAVGGNVAGSVLKQYDLGALGNLLPEAWAAVSAANC